MTPDQIAEKAARMVLGIATLAPSGDPATDLHSIHVDQLREILEIVYIAGTKANADSV